MTGNIVQTAIMIILNGCDIVSPPVMAGISEGPFWILFPEAFPVPLQQHFLPMAGQGPRSIDTSQWYTTLY